MLDDKLAKTNLDLFHLDKNSQHIVAISNSGKLEDDFFKYASWFYEAAEHVIHYLAEKVAQEHDIRKLDLWYFPMVYLYRHSLELLLKATIFRLENNPDTRKNIIGDIRHDLWQAFDTLVQIGRISVGENKNAKWLTKYLSDISLLDKESDMFRYPFGNQLEVLTKEQRNISLVATHDNMNKAYNIIKMLFNTGCFDCEDIEAYKPNLFIDGGCYYQQSVIGYKYSEYSYYPYFESYYEVGNFLKDIIISENKSSLFLPMCYLYRNAVELGLKRLIVEDSHLNRERAFKIIRKKKHSILGLWNSIIDEINAYTLSPNQNSMLDTVRKHIDLFHNLDNSSDLFRYPCNKNMDTYFLPAKKFNIEQVALCFKELCDLLDSIDDMLGIVKEIESEMYAEMAGYCDC